MNERIINYKHLEYLSNIFNRNLLLVIFLFISYESVNCQTKITVSGVVLEKNSNNCLPGASVIIDGTNVGTITNFDGEYSLEVEDYDTLRFSYVGFESIKIPVKEHGSYRIVELIEYPNWHSHLIITKICRVGYYGDIQCLPYGVLFDYTSRWISKIVGKAARGSNDIIFQGKTNLDGDWDLKAGLGGIFLDRNRYTEGNLSLEFNLHARDMRKLYKDVKTLDYSSGLRYIVKIKQHYLFSLEAGGVWRNDILNDELSYYLKFRKGLKPKIYVCGSMVFFKNNLEYTASVIKSIKIGVPFKLGFQYSKFQQYEELSMSFCYLFNRSSGNVVHYSNGGYSW